MTPIGIKLWYADGTKLSIALADLAAQWPAVRATGVQTVAVFFVETYDIWLQDGSDEHGQPINQRRVTQTYRVLLGPIMVGSIDLVTGTFHKREREADYYWFDAAQRNLGAGLAGDVPVGLPVGAVKTGSLLADAAFRAVFDAAAEDRVWP